MIKALIIDDDAMSCQQLNDLLASNSKDIEIKEICHSGPEGIKAIAKWQPDLVFLDVEMPGMNGFDMLKKVGDINFEIIFTTAHDQYAIRAIRFAALDYLLKPVHASQLQETISLVLEKIGNKRNAGHYHQAVNGLSSEKGELANLAVPTVEGFVFVPVADIVRCEADDKYTKIFMADKRMIYSSRTLGDFEELLQPSGFIRIHKSHLINIAHLKKYLRGEGGQVIMSDGSALDVSRRKKDDLLQIVTQFK